MTQPRRLAAGLAFAAALVGTSLSGCREVPRPVTIPAPRAAVGASPPPRAREGGGTQTAEHREPTAVDDATAPTARDEAPAWSAADPGTRSVPSAGWGTRIDMTGQAMGTRIAMSAYVDATHDEAMLRSALGAAFQEVLRLEGLMTPWRDTSELSRVNASAGRAPVPVGPEMLEVIGKSLWVAEHSEGVFDITFASMGKLWRFNHDMDGAVPPADAIARARRRIDYRQVHLDREAGTVFLARADRRIDLGGIAKGFAVDRAAEVLVRAGIQAFYVQAGGDLYVRGRKPDGTPWRVGVRDPRGPDGSFFARLPVEDHAFSTAGDYERSFFKDGKRYHHILDPRTGYPAARTRSVTIWAKDAFTADAIDDAVFILGPEKGLALVESIPDCGAVLVDASNKVWVSQRLEGLVERFRDPTDGP